MAKARIVYQVDDKQLNDLQKQLDEIKKSNKDVEDSFKGSNEEIKKGGGALNDLKGTIAGLGLAAVATKAVVEFAKLTQEVNKNRKEVALLTNETGKALDSITAKIRATSGVFDKDFNEVLKTANSLSKTFQISMTEAIDEVNEGFLRGLDINGDYLETLNEYDVFIQKLGIDVRQFNALIQKQVTDGVFSDKGIDALKEAQLSLQEMTPAAEQALKAIGLNSNEVIRDIQSGTKTYFESIQEIAKRTRELADPTKTGAILADIFRGAGEDAFDYILTIDQVGESFTDVTEAQQKYIDNQKDLLKSSEDVNEELTRFSQNWAGLSSTLGTFLNKVGAETLGWINDVIESFDRAATKEKGYREELEQLSETEQRLNLDLLNAQLTEQSAILEEAEQKYANLSETAKKYGQGSNIEAQRQRVADLNTQIAILNQLEEERNTQKKIKEEEELAKKIEAEAKARALAAAAAEEQNKKEDELAKQRLENSKKFIEDSELEKQGQEFELSDEQKNLLSLTNVIFGKNTIDEDAQNFIEKIGDTIKKVAEKSKDYKAQELEAEKEHQDKKREIIQTATDGFLDILGSFNDLRIQQINNELQANEIARNRELELAEGNTQKQIEINKKFDTEQAKLRNKQVQAEKQSQIFSAIINTARAVASALPNIPLSILVGALGAAQIGFIAAQQPPKFAKGVIDLQGPGTSTSDSIPAYLSVHESVMTGDETRDFMPTLKAIRAREIKPEILNNFVLKGQSNPIILDNYDKLAEAVINQPKFNMNMDENGFGLFMQKQMSSLSIKQSKYRM